MDFTKNLLKDKNQLIGVMDSTITGFDPAPASPYSQYDPSFDPLYGPVSAAMSAYVREDLKFRSDLFYEFLNMRVNENWDWSSGLVRKQGFIDVTHKLRDALAVNKNLKIFIASGLFDLTTPYFAAEYTLTHMWLRERKANIIFKTYLSGHMIYTHLDELKKLYEDSRAFYLKSVESYLKTP